MADRARSQFVVWWLAAATVAAHIAFNGRYGIFRDELYYLACADRLAWGYVDHPPLSIAALAAWRALAGEAVGSLQVVPALLHGLVVLGAAALARRMGGRAFAPTLAALCAAVAPQWLALTGFWSMNAFDLAIWTAAFLVVASLLAGGDGRLWVVLGAVLGLGLMNKLSVLFLAAGLAVGLVLSPLRRDLRSRQVLLGAGVAGVIFLPHIAWQVANDWPTAEFIANAQAYKIAAFSPRAMIADQALGMLPPAIAVWGVGLGALLFWGRLRTFRPLGIAFVVVLGILLVERSKPYYLAPAYPPLLAGGAIAWESLSERVGWRWLRPALAAVIGGAGLALAPLAIPVLPVETFVSYQRSLGIAPAASERQDIGALPQHFADRFGWPEMAEQVARVWRSLPAEDRQRCLVLGRNYGQAGALRYYGRELGLPFARSQHNSFFEWGPGAGPYEAVLAIGYRRDDLLEAFEEVVEVGRFSHPWVMPYENDQPIFVCRRPRRPFEELWRDGKLFI